jgi:hypothetical protein
VFRVVDVVYIVYCLVFRVQCVGRRAYCLGLMVKGLKVQGLGLGR